MTEERCANPYCRQRHPIAVVYHERPVCSKCYAEIGLLPPDQLRARLKVKETDRLHVPAEAVNTCSMTGAER